MSLFGVTCQGPLALVLVLVTACQDRPKIAEPTPVAVTSTVAKAAASSATVALALDDALMNELEQRGKSCEPVPGEGRFRCAGGANWAIVGDFLEKRRDRAGSVATMAKALEHEHPGVRGLSVTVLAGAFATLWGRDPSPGKVTPDAAAALLRNTLQLPQELAARALPAAVNACMLAGKGELVLAELAKPARVSFRAAAYPHLMTFGRLGAFDKVREAVGSSDQTLALAALDAPVSMESWTDAEEQAICSWAEGLQSDPRPALRPKVDLILGNCSGARLDGLLARAEELAKKSQLDMPTQQALVAMCNRVRRPVLRATEQQCGRARAAFVATAQAKGAEGKDRAHAINWIARLWPDAQSQNLLERLRRDPDSRIGNEAGEGLKWIAASKAPPPAEAAQLSH